MPRPLLYTALALLSASRQSDSQGLLSPARNLQLDDLGEVPDAVGLVPAKEKRHFPLYALVRE